MSNKHIDLTAATVVIPPAMSGPARKAVDMLVDEVEKRTTVRWAVESTWPHEATVPAIVVAPAADLAAVAGPHAELLDGDASAAEGYRLRTAAGGGASGTVYVVGNDARGVLFGVGHLLRTMSMQRGEVTVPAGLSITTAPRYPLRGHQLGYRDKTNAYCGWDLAQWEQYYRDLALFGCNAIELIPPRSDDNPDSVHFPLPPLDMMAGMSHLADEYGLEVWIWFPAMDADYGDPAVVEFALNEWDEVFRALPRIDALFVPGGDPGHTAPRDLMPLLEEQTALLKQHHPQAQMWVSPQGFDRAWMDEFVGFLRDESPAWLDGVVFGPWVLMTTAEFRALIPERYPIRNYPDITHNFSCQHPVPNWDVAYAVTEGRESINPRPRGMATIFSHEQPPTIGFLSYSEGCNDDVNKCIWSALGWDPERSVIDILREYSRVYIGERYADDFAQGLLALERNWEGPLACNAGVYTTLLQFQAMEAAAAPHTLKNWRFQQALYRAYYDAYIRTRLLYEISLEEQAMEQLRRAPAAGALRAMDEAARILERAVDAPIARDWHTRLYQLAEALFQSVHMQLSVPLYRAQSEVRGANLDGVDSSLNNRHWLEAHFAEIRALEDEDARRAAIRSLLEWPQPGPGGFYDDLSKSCQEDHLVPGLGFERDPTFLHTAMRHYTYRKDDRPLRTAWQCRTGSLGDAPFEVRYEDLDPAARYRVCIAYSDANLHIPVRLEADRADGQGAVEVHPWFHKPAFSETGAQPVEFDVPAEATQGGTLTLRWFREPGHGRAGRGCEICEIWLIKAG
jgi:hypothetical protein